MLQTTIIPAPTIQEYIEKFPVAVQQLLQEIRQTIQAAAPLATEGISYQMPAFKQHGVLVYFAAWKHHIGFYPVTSIHKIFEKELGHVVVEKGTLRFSLDKPFPHELIKKIVAYRVQENEAKFAAKLLRKPKKKEGQKPKNRTTHI